MKKFMAVLLCAMMLVTLIPASVSANTAVAPDKPKVNNRVDPLGIDLDSELRFSWVMNSDTRNDYQTAYQIVVSSENGDGDMWDTGKVVSDNTLSVAYEGAPLSSKSVYRVKVKTWDKAGNESPFSEEAVFETAFLTDGEWEAAWITHMANMNYMRKEFEIPAGKEIKRARAYATGQGIYYMYLNGQKVGDRYLDPMRTYYYGPNARILYSTYDITEYLQTGANAVGFLLNEGYRSASGPWKALCQIEITFTDGTTMQVLSDDTWKGYQGGPYISKNESNLPDVVKYRTYYSYFEDGEIYDARKEAQIEGWNKPGFNDSSWITVQAQLPAIHGGNFNNVNTECELLSTAPAIDNWNDHTYSARFRTNNSGSYVALKFAYSDAGYGYMWQLSGNHVRPHYSNPGYGLYSHSTLEGGVTIQPGTWYTLDIKIMADKIETYVDGTLVNTTTKEEMEAIAPGTSNYRSGKFGVRQAVSDDCDIDWIAITDGSGKEVWRDDFNDATYWEIDSMRRVAQKSGTVANTILTPTLIAEEGNILRYDAGKNISGFVEATFNGPEGGMAIIRCAEDLNDDGTLNRDSYYIYAGGKEAPQFTALNTDYYTLKGAKNGERYTPLFTSHGFRYFEIELPEGTTVSDVTAVAISADIDVTAEFESSNELINMFYEAFLWGMRDNTIFFPHGGNNRKERHAWMHDGALVTTAALTYYDSASFFEKWLDDIMDGDVATGFAANITPNEGIDANPDPIWTSGTVTIAYEYYKETGDITYIEQYYPRAKRFAEAVRGFSVEGGTLLKQGNGLNSHWTDWLALYNNDYGIGDNDKANRDYYMSAYYYKIIYDMYLMAEALGYEEDAATYGNLSSRIKDAINAKFYADGSYDIDLKDGQYDQGRGEVAANALALAMGLVPEEEKENVVITTVNGLLNPPQKAGHPEVEEMHPTFGVLGATSIFSALTKSGFEAELFEMATQETYPSFGYMMLEGPGTYWETWTNTRYLSLNHPFFGGGISTWVLNSIGGIKNTDIAYKAVEIRPYVDDPSLTYANTILTTQRGVFTNSWTKNGTNFNMTVTIPANTVATVYVPIPKTGTYTVTESGADITKQSSGDIKYLQETEDHYLVYEVGSGTYTFVQSGEGGASVTVDPVTGFADISNHWSKEYVQKTASLGIINGTSVNGLMMFLPDNNTTRAEFSAMIVRMLDLAPVDSAPFTDVAADAWYYQSVASAAAAGLVKGVTDTTFDPNRSITRQEAMVILKRVADSKGVGTAGDVSAVANFIDSGNIADWAADSIAFGIANGLTVGYADGSFGPLNSITRAEIVTMLSRFLAL